MESPVHLGTMMRAPTVAKAIDDPSTRHGRLCLVALDPAQPNAQPSAMRTLGTCSRNIEPIAKPVSTRFVFLHEEQ